MEISVIPWRVFFDTLRKQQSSTIAMATSMVVYQ